MPKARVRGEGGKRNGCPATRQRKIPVHNPGALRAMDVEEKARREEDGKGKKW